MLWNVLKRPRPNSSSPLPPVLCGSHLCVSCIRMELWVGLSWVLMPNRLSTEESLSLQWPPLITLLALGCMDAVPATGVGGWTISCLSHFEGGRVCKNSSVWKVSESASMVLMQRFQLRGPLTIEVSVQGTRRKGGRSRQIHVGWSCAGQESMKGRERKRDWFLQVLSRPVIQSAHSVNYSQVPTS